MSKKIQNYYTNKDEHKVLSCFHVAFAIDDNLIEHGREIFSSQPITLNGKSYEINTVGSYGYEPSFAPNGKTVLQFSIAQDEDDYNYWKSLSSEQYKQEKARLTCDVTKIIVAQYPQLSDSIEYLDSWTPITYNKYCNSYYGSYMSFVMQKNMKMANISSKIKGIKNLFIASQWQLVPGGLPTAVVMGKFAVQWIKKSN